MFITHIVIVALTSLVARLYARARHPAAAPVPDPSPTPDELHPLEFDAFDSLDPVDRAIRRKYKV